ncbi:MAG TPA: PAS domain-containing sensor histidine kinase [Phototrophicaceae bacterium]|nr:PAS domain-containing sensor histidine kinase [Phototrophicaceae bacterium]
MVNHSLSDPLDLNILMTIFQTMPVAILVVNLGGKIQMGNAAAKRILQYYSGVETLSALVAADSGFEPLERILTENPPPENQWQFDLHCNGNKRDYVVPVIPYDNSDQQRSFVVLLHDVTELLDQGRFKNEMLKLASHDLRSPLALIISYCELMDIEIGTTSPRLNQYVSVVRQSAVKMKRLLDATLRVEQVRSWPLDLHQPVSSVELVNTLLTHVRLLAATKKQQLECQLQPDLAPIRVDAVLIQEAMENLVNNAIKYTPEGGQITIRVYTETERFHFVVEDNGLGIGAEHLPHLFESFYRARQPGTETIEGTGLGLSLVKTIIERHQGEVWVKSEAGQGSRFGFWLPLPTAKD